MLILGGVNVKNKNDTVVTKMSLLQVSRDNSFSHVNVSQATIPNLTVGNLTITRDLNLVTSSALQSIAALSTTGNEMLYITAPNTYITIPVSTLATEFLSQETSVGMTTIIEAVRNVDGASINNSIVRFMGTTGLEIQNSLCTVSDGGLLYSPAIQIADTLELCLVVV